MNVSHKKVGVGIVAAAALLLGSAAIADNSSAGRMGDKMGGPMGMMRPAFDFAAADADKDGKITAAEFTAWRAASAVALDADKDGKLSATELATRSTADDAATKAEAMVKNLDTDGDGKISAAELLGIPAGVFDRADANKDGSVDQAEADAFAKMAMHGPEGRGDGHGGKRHGGKGDHTGDGQDAPAGNPDAPADGN